MKDLILSNCIVVFSMLLGLLVGWNTEEESVEIIKKYINKIFFNF